jgi:hypothetical protein
MTPTTSLCIRVFTTALLAPGGALSILSFSLEIQTFFSFKISFTFPVDTLKRGFFWQAVPLPARLPL